MIVLLLAAAALTMALRDWTDFVVITAVVVLNSAVGVLQEVRAEHALAALRQLTAPSAKVLRDGQVRERPAADLVPRDVVVLDAGDVVPADADILTAVRLQVDEAALTGESVPIDKDPDHPDSELGKVFAGTVVTRGRATVFVTATGAASALGRIAQLLAEQRPGPTPLQVRLAALGRVLALAAVLLSALVLFSGLARGRPPSEMVLTAVSLAVAAVPESLPAVVTLALAIGARRMARKSAVVRRLPAVETLGSVTVVAADKTGTLTEGRMLVERVWTADGEYAVTGSGYEPFGAIQPLANAAAPGSGFRAMLRDLVLCNDADLQPPADSSDNWRPRGDPTEVALLVLAAKAGVQASVERDLHPRVGEIPFDSLRKRMTTIHELSERGHWLVVCKGAPEVLLGVPGLIRDDSATESFRSAAATLARAGYRVLALARRGTDHSDIEDAERDLRFVALVAITDPPRDNAGDVVRAVHDAGVDLLLITGDHPETARAIAERLAIRGHERIATGSDLERDDLAVGAEAPRVYARTRPEQKLDIVRAWQRAGHVVAMTGDGVNDAPALRRADIGVAMGKDGTEVARQAADLVITDDDLGTVVAAVEEGRRIYANVRTFLRYALSGGVAEVLVMLMGPLVGLAVPLLPAQILWINLLTHGLPGVAMGAEPAEPEVMRKRPRSPQEFVLGGGLWLQIAWTGVLIAGVSLAVGWWAQGNDGLGQTLVFLVLGLAQLGVAIALRRRGEPGRRRMRFLDVAVLGAVLLQLAGIYVPVLADLLGTSPLPWRDLLIGALVAAVPGSAIALIRVLRRVGDDAVPRDPDSFC
jgi:Ca2+-transporting ATPase